MKFDILDKTASLKRPSLDKEELQETVAQVFKDVAQNTDKAVQKYTELFDGIRLTSLQVTTEEKAEAVTKTEADLKQAIDLAYQNIKTFHEAQYTPGTPVVETAEGVSCWQETRPIQKVGIYVPGGSAPLFSTVLMLGIPAQIAGCKEVILCTPPDKNGQINPAILYAAQKVGIEKIFKVGGIQAIAAMTYGTQEIPKVYKIFGPGNQYVTAAKQYALNLGVAIDMPAGPSEVMVVADKTAVPAFVASDLLSQAEHGPDSQVVCISNSKEFLSEVIDQINVQLPGLSRQDIARKALENSKFVYIDNPQDTIDKINDYAPEHLILSTADNDFYLKNLCNAGSVFIGNYTPESAGDYASGTNHTLPTNGFAKAYSGVGTDSFVKKISFQKITAEGLKNIGKAIEIMAAKEGLQAHKNAVSLRLEEVNKIEGVK